MIDLNFCFELQKQVLQLFKTGIRLFYFKVSLQPIYKFYFQITGVGINVMNLNFEWTNGICSSMMMGMGSIFFDRLLSLKTKLIFKIFEKKFILTRDFTIKFKDGKFYLTVLGKDFQVISPNTTNEPHLIYVEPLGINMKI